MYDLGEFTRHYPNGRVIVSKLKGKDFDGLNFYRNEDCDLEITGFSYRNAGEKIGGTEMSDFYLNCLVAP